MATRSELEDQVGYKLGLTIDANSIPSNTQVQQWLNEGQLDVARKIHPQLAPDLIEVESININAGDETFALSSLSKPFIKLIACRYAASATDTDRPCKIVDAYSHSALVRAGDFLKPTSDDPIVSVQNGNLAFYPTADAVGGGDAVVTYLREPDTLSADGTECELPAFLEDLVVDYAVIQAKIQDEQFDQAMLLYKNYLINIAVLNRQATQRRLENV